LGGTVQASRGKSLRKVRFEEGQFFRCTFRIPLVCMWLKIAPLKGFVQRNISAALSWRPNFAIVHMRMSLDLKSIDANIASTKSDYIAASRRELRAPA